MNDNNSLEHMLNQLADIFKIVEEGKTKPLDERVTPEIRAHLEQLKKVIDQFVELNAQVFSSGGVSESDLKKIIDTPPPSMSAKQKRVIEFSKKLKKDVDNAKASLVETAPKEKIMYNKEKQSAEDVAKRKKKFKRMGGNWL